MDKEVLQRFDWELAEFFECISWKELLGARSDLVQKTLVTGEFNGQYILLGIVVQGKALHAIIANPSGARRP